MPLVFPTSSSVRRLAWGWAEVGGGLDRLLQFTGASGSPLAGVGVCPAQAPLVKMCAKGDRHPKRETALNVWRDFAKFSSRRLALLKFQNNRTSKTAIKVPMVSWTIVAIGRPDQQIKPRNRCMNIEWLIEFQTQAF